MALVSISEAINLSGISRGTFYRKYLNAGLISTTQDSDGKKQIDTSELLRVFPDMSMDSGTVQPVQDGQSEISSLELQVLRQQLEEAKQRELKSEEREKYYQQLITEEKARAERAEVKLLAYQEPSISPDPVQTEIAELRESLRQLSARRWWQVWK